MGFFKKIFAKKKGGTLFGNLLRGVSSAATGGILGSGAQLAKNDAKIEAKETQQAQAEQDALIREQLEQNKAYQMGKSAGEPLNDMLSASGAKALNTTTGKKIQMSVIKVWLKANWWKVLVPAIIIIGTVIYFIRRGRNSQGSKVVKRKN